MKQLIFFFLAIFGGSLYAQRLLPYQKGVELRFALPPTSLEQPLPIKDFSAATAYIAHTAKAHYWRYSGAYTRALHSYKDIDIPVEQFSLSATYNHRLLKDRKTFFSLLIGGGSTVGYQLINHSQPTLPDGARIKSQEGLYYGATANLTAEFFLSDNLLFFTFAQTDLLFGTALARLNPTVGIGIRTLF